MGRSRRSPPPHRRPSGARAPSSRSPRRPRWPIARASLCRSTTPAGCGSASTVTWPSPSPPHCPPRRPRTTSAASAPRSTRCWSTAGRCPSPASTAAWRPPTSTRRGQPVEPRSVDRAIPFQISAAAARAVQENGGIRSAPTLLNLLQQATAVADRTETHHADRRTRRRPLPQHGRPPRTRRRPQAQGAVDRHRRRRRPSSSSPSSCSPQCSAASSATSVARSTRTNSASTRPPVPPRAPRTGVVKPVKATVFSPGGEADNPEMAAMAIDGNPSTAWQTDTYSDPVPFPGFKNGVGLILQLPRPTTIASVTSEPQQHRHVDPDPLRADRATPATLDDTTGSVAADADEDRLEHHHHRQPDADVERAGVDHDARHRGRQERDGALGHHAQGRLLAPPRSSPRPGVVGTSSPGRSSAVAAVAAPARPKKCPGGCPPVH